MAKKDEKKIETPLGTEPKKEEMVEVKREDLNKLLATLAKNQEQIDLLYKAADKGLMSKALNASGKELIPTVKIHRWGDTGKYVVGWGPMIKNIAESIMGRPVEDQVRKMFLDDGEEVIVPYLESIRRSVVVDVAEIIGKNEKLNSLGERVIEFKVQFPNGKVLLIDNTFVN